MKSLLICLLFAAFSSSLLAKSNSITMKTVEMPITTKSLQADPGQGLAQVTQVIQVTRDIVALGETIYSIVQKGKPTNTSDYAPIAIVPKDATTRQTVDPMDLETCSFPTRKKYVTTMKSGSTEVVKFEYMVVFTHSCSYNGAGKYIQSAIVQPLSVKVGYDWDVNASLKLNGVMNHGTKASPNVGALLTLKYTMNSWRTAFEKNATIHIAGNGSVTNYAAE